MNLLDPCVLAMLLFYFLKLESVVHRRDGYMLTKIGDSDEPLNIML